MTKLEKILKDDELFGDVKPASAPTSTDEQRILQDFEAINIFIDRHGHKPGKAENPSVSERSLQNKLNGLLNDPANHMMLYKHDRYGLLQSTDDRP